MKNLNELSKLLCHYEKGASEVNVAQMKEIITKLAVLFYENPEVIGMLLNLAKKKKGL